MRVQPSGAANPLKENFVTSCCTVPLFSIQALTLWICIQINSWELVFHTKCSVYVEEGEVNTLQVFKGIVRIF